MKKTKNTIIMLSILMIILMAIVLILGYVLKISQKESDNRTPIITGEIENPYGVPQEITWLEYNTINVVLNRYMQIINKNNSTYKELQRSGEQDTKIDNQINNLILNTLSDTYIEKNKITNENLRRYISLESEQLVFIPLKIKMLTEETIKTYAVEGIAQNVKYESKGNRCYIVNIDYSNKIFSIEPTQKKYDEIIQVDKTTNIDKKENNEYTNTTISNQSKTQEYISIYKRLALSAPELVYEHMEEEYRNKRFGTEDEFKNYIENNRRNIEALSLEQYLVKNDDNYIEYVGKDKYENLYIFDEKSVLDYTIKLDTYTIPTEKFKETYNNAKDDKKVQMNIDKFFQMINRQDYRTAYNCLAQSYKNNYFKNEEEFTKYVKNNFFTYNKVTYQKYEQKGDRLYVFDIKLTDLSGESTEKKEIKIIMQLNDNLEFEMSFGV